MPDYLVTWKNGISTTGPCPICAPLEGTRGRLSEIADFPGLPPLHDNCVCDVIPVSSAANQEALDDTFDAYQQWLIDQGFNDIAVGEPPPSAVARGPGAVERWKVNRRARNDAERAKLLEEAARLMRAGAFG